MASIRLYYDNSRDLYEGLIIEIDNGVQNQVGQIFPEFRAEYGELIVAAVNACLSVNPENPLAVARNIKEMVKILRMVFARQAIDGSRVVERGMPSGEEVFALRDVLAKINAKVKGGEINE